MKYILIRSGDLVTQVDENNYSTYVVLYLFKELPDWSLWQRFSHSDKRRNAVTLIISNGVTVNITNLCLVDKFDDDYFKMVINVFQSSKQVILKGYTLKQYLLHFRMEGHIVPYYTHIGGLKDRLSHYWKWFGTSE